MVNNLRFLFSRTLKNVSIHILTATSSLSIFLFYLVSVLVQNKKIEGGVFDASSGLVGGFHQHMIIFIIAGLTIACITVFIHKSPQNDEYELNLITRHASRMTIISSRILFTLGYVFFYILIQMVLLVLPAMTDDILLYSERVKWLFSIVLGLFFATIITASIATFLALFFGLFLSIAISSIFVIGFPIVSWMQYSLSKPEPVINGDGDAKLMPVGSFLSGNVYENYEFPVTDDHKIIISNQNLEIIKKRFVHTFMQDNSLDKKIEKYNKSLLYEKLTQVDQWNSFKNYFNVFMPHNLNNAYSYKEYKKMKISEMYNFKDEDILTFGGIKYVNILPTTTNIAKYPFNKYTRITHTVNTPERTKKIIDDIFNELESNDTLANEYKHMPFMEQCSFWDTYINLYEESLDGSVKNMLNHKVTRQEMMDEFAYSREHNDVISPEHQKTFVSRYLCAPTNVGSADWYNYFFEVQRMADHNPARYKATTFEGSYAMHDNILVHSPYGIVRLDKEFWVEETKNYETKSVGAYIIPLIASALLIATLFMYTRRDIK